MLGLMLLLVCNCQKNQQNCYSARLTVRQGTDSPLSAVPTLFSVVSPHLEGHHRKVDGHINHFVPLDFQLLPAPLAVMM